MSQCISKNAENIDTITNSQDTQNVPIIDFILHIDQHLIFMTQNYGTWVYGILFLIIFCETGLVVTPFLPGDSLLFATGAIAATGALDPVLVSGLIIIAAFMGDNVNYWFGRTAGPRVFSSSTSRIFNRKHLERTEEFYAKHGHKAVIIARFLPIFRTFIPFVAGIGRMPYLRFLGFSLTASLMWVLLFVGAGYFFGNIPAVKKNFTLLIMAIIVVSLLPAVYGFIKHKYAKSESV